MSDRTWLAIIVVAALVYGTRVLGPLLVSGLTISRRTERFLNALALSVIVGIVVTALARAGLREYGAVAASMIAMLALRSTFWAMAAGIVVAAVWTRIV